MRVSILIPSYNHAGFLRACLESVLAQHYQDWEVVLVDDGSTDESVDVARTFKSERVNVYANEQNLGTYGTQQRALELSKGELVAVLNSDDLWAPEKLAQQVELLDRTPNATLCYTFGSKVDEHGKLSAEDVHSDWPTDPQQEILPYLLYENRVLASSALFRREGLRFDGSCRYSGDWVALLDRAQPAPVGCVAERLTFWRMHTSNTFRRSANQAREEIRVRRSILAQSSRWFVERLDPSSLRRGMAMNAMNLAALYVLFSDTASARSAALQAVRWMPSKRLALRRLAATFLPPDRALRRLWPGEQLLGRPNDIGPFEPIEWA